MEQSAHLDPYVPLEEVARRLDLPLGILLRRAEAGDIPARRLEGPEGVTYSVRLSDLGVERDDSGAEAGDAGFAAAVDIVGSAQRWPEPEAMPPAVQETRRQEPAEVRHPEAADLVPAIQSRDSGRFPTEPHREVAAMTLDPREVVAGLLDRWERTLEQRIYAEQRQRFESELNARQNLVKQLQLELQTVRAENAATLADRDRRLADSDRSIAQLRQELAAAREGGRRRNRLFRH